MGRLLPASLRAATQRQAQNVPVHINSECAKSGKASEDDPEGVRLAPGSHLAFCFFRERSS
jgi:hypothetical protein